MKTILSLFCICLFSGCVGRTLHITLPEYRTLPGPSAIAEISSRRIQLGAFVDSRPQVVIIGERKAAFGVEMDKVILTQQANTLVRNVVISELLTAGHALVKEEPDVVLTGIIRRFDIRTNTTPLYWDIIGTLHVEIYVGKSLRRYLVVCDERTYIWPKEEMIVRILTACLDKFALRLKADSELAAAIHASNFL